MTFAIAAAAIGPLLLLFTLSSLRELAPRELGGYACLFQLLLAALIGAALTADLFNLFVWFEVAALSSYGLTGFFLERPIALEAAFKVLVLTTLASFFIFIGAALLYADHGALNFAQLHARSPTAPSTTDMVALALLVCGFATKAGLVPFHGWLPDAHTAAPGPVSALFSGLMVNLGIVAIARIALQLYGPAAAAPALGTAARSRAVSALIGALLALAQDDLKRLLAYDTVSQMGVLDRRHRERRRKRRRRHHLSPAQPRAVQGAAVPVRRRDSPHHRRHRALKDGRARAPPAGARRRLHRRRAGIAGMPLLSGYPSLGTDPRRDPNTDPAAYAVELIAQVDHYRGTRARRIPRLLPPRREPYERFDHLHPGMTAALWTLGAAASRSA